MRVSAGTWSWRGERRLTLPVHGAAHTRPAARSDGTPTILFRADGPVAVLGTAARLQLHARTVATRDTPFHKRWHQAPVRAGRRGALVVAASPVPRDAERYSLTVRTPHRKSNAPMSVRGAWIVIHFEATGRPTKRRQIKEISP